MLPDGQESRHDIIQAITFGTPEGVIAFCRGIQAAAPVDSFVEPEPWAMPGYDSEVIMPPGPLSRAAVSSSPPTGPSAALRRVLPGRSYLVPRQAGHPHEPPEAGGGRDNRAAQSLRKRRGQKKTVLCDRLKPITGESL